MLTKSKWLTQSEPKKIPSVSDNPEWSFLCFVGEKRFECPLCSVVCSNSYSLQEHVEVHLDHGAAMNPAGGHTFIPLCCIIHSVTSTTLPVVFFHICQMCCTPAVTVKSIYLTSLELKTFMIHKFLMSGWKLFIATVHVPILAPLVYLCR